MKSHQFKVALIGEVDSGKSTTLGQILLQSNSVLPSKILDAKNASELNGNEFEPAFLLDAFEIERTQEMTVDITTTTCFVRDRRISFLDTPGHRHLSNKFIGGAADVDLAVLILDVKVKPTQSHFRHLKMLRKIGLRQFAVLINKLDEVNCQDQFNHFVEAIEEFIIDFKNEILFVAPVDAKKGLGFSKQDFPWFSGACIFDSLATTQERSSNAGELFCIYRKIDEDSVWLSCLTGTSKSAASLFIGEKRVSDGAEALHVNEAPWVGQVPVFIPKNDPTLPDSGIISERQDSTEFRDHIVSDLIHFGQIAGEQFILRNFWTSVSCRLTQDPGSGLFSIKLGKKIQLYSQNKRYNLFTIEHSGKIIALGIPQ